MATMGTEHDRLVEQARSIAVQLDAELALVASLVRTAHDAGQIGHFDRAHVHRGRTHPNCAGCQLVAWAATA